MSIVIEFPVPPSWIRNSAMWKELQVLGATDHIVLRTTFRSSEDLVLITATSRDDLSRIGEVEVPGNVFRAWTSGGSYYEDRANKEIEDALRFAVWKLVHTGEDDEEDE